MHCENGSCPTSVRLWILCQFSWRWLAWAVGLEARILLGYISRPIVSPYGRGLAWHGNVEEKVYVFHMQSWLQIPDLNLQWWVLSSNMHDKEVIRSKNKHSIWKPWTVNPRSFSSPMFHLQLTSHVVRTTCSKSNMCTTPPACMTCLIDMWFSTLSDSPQNKQGTIHKHSTLHVHLSSNKKSKQHINQIVLKRTYMMNINRTVFVHVIPYQARLGRFPFGASAWFSVIGVSLALVLDFLATVFPLPACFLDLLPLPFEALSGFVFFSLLSFLFLPSFLPLHLSSSFSMLLHVFIYTNWTSSNETRKSRRCVFF